MATRSKVKAGKSRRSAKKNTVHRSPVDQHAATELVMYIENTSDLSPDGPGGQGRSVLLNALRKWRKGTYDPAMAVRLFGYLAEAGAKRYAKEMGSSEKEWSTMFNPATRQEAARQLEESFRSSVENGEYDHVDTRIGVSEEDNRRHRAARGEIDTRTKADFERWLTAVNDALWISHRELVEDFGAEGRKRLHEWWSAGLGPHSAGERLHSSVRSQRTAQEPSRKLGMRARSDDRPISMTYGTLPPFEEFERDIRRPNPDESDGSAYWPPGTEYPMELVDSREIELAEEFGLESFTPGRYAHKSGFKGNERQIYDFIKFLMDQDDAYSGEEGSPGDLASSIMTTLGYEWL